MSRLGERLPSRAQLVPVYAVIVLMIYAWTLMWFLWKVPSWLLYMNAEEILMALAYSLTTNLVESLLVLCVPVLLALALPGRWFREVFVARGAALAIAGLGCLMILAYNWPTKGEPPEIPLPLWAVAVVLALIALLIYFSGRDGLLRRGLEALADRVTIFLYIFTPLSLLALVVILVRMLTG